MPVKLPLVLITMFIFWLKLCKTTELRAYPCSLAGIQYGKCLFTIIVFIVYSCFVYSQQDIWGNIITMLS